MTTEVGLMLRVKDKSELLAMIEEYIAKSGCGATRFGWLATGDLSLVTKLRHKEGYDPHLSTVTRVLEYMGQHPVEAVDPAEGL
jgi:hypothetical protein